MNITGSNWLEPLHLGRRLQHHPAHRRSVLAGREELHRPITLSSLSVARPPDCRSERRCRRMHHGVDVAATNHLGDERVSDIGPDKLLPGPSGASGPVGRHRVDGDHPSIDVFCASWAVRYRRGTALPVTRTTFGGGPRRGRIHPSGLPAGTPRRGSGAKRKRAGSDAGAES